MAITRFRIEAEGFDKPALIEEISGMVARTIRAAGEGELQPVSVWECTDEAITGNEKKGYKARMVLKLDQNGTS